MRPKQAKRQRGRASRIVAAPFSRRLVVMVKEPQLGRVKTRLGRQIGAVAATFFYRHAARAVIRRLAASSQWRTCLAVAPDTQAGSGFWPGQIARRGQGGGDLGQRMQSIMRWPGQGPILIIGTDIPAIEPQHIRDAFRLLARADAVLGPTPDGGYWLVGLRRAPRVLEPFGNVRWSSEHALTDTAGNLSGRGVAMAETLLDVDCSEDWLGLRAWSGRVVLSKGCC